MFLEAGDAVEGGLDQGARSEERTLWGVLVSTAHFVTSWPGVSGDCAGYAGWVQQARGFRSDAHEILGPTFRTTDL